LTSTSTSNYGGQELQYLEQDVSFFQLWALTTDLGLHSTLFSVPKPSSEEITGPQLHISAPTIKLTQSLRSKGPQFVHDSFIVADGMNDERSLGHEFGFRGTEMHSNIGRDEDDLRFTLNWKVIFQQAFGLSKVHIGNIDNDDDDDDDTVSQEEGETRLKECLDRVSSHIQEGISQEKLLSGTLYMNPLFLAFPD
jgi:RNA polymerase I-specific transcription initiation factor RRN6